MLLFTKLAPKNLKDCDLVLLWLRWSFNILFFLFSFQSYYFLLIHKLQNQSSIFETRSALYYTIFLFFLHLECKTSLTDSGPRQNTALNQTCKFPFKVAGKTYHTCTYDHSGGTGFKPWCSVRTDEFNNHIRDSDPRAMGKPTYGICDDYKICPIQTRRKCNY